MSEELAQGIVASARVLEADSKSKRQYASLQFIPGSQDNACVWKVVVPAHFGFGMKNHFNLAEALQYLAEHGFYVSPTKAEEYLAKRNDHHASGNTKSLEFIVWTDM